MPAIQLSVSVEPRQAFDVEDEAGTFWVTRVTVTTYDLVGEGFVISSDYLHTIQESVTDSLLGDDLPARVATALHNGITDLETELSTDLPEMRRRLRPSRRLPRR